MPSAREFILIPRLISSALSIAQPSMFLAYIRFPTSSSNDIEEIHDPARVKIIIIMIPIGQEQIDH